MKIQTFLAISLVLPTLVGCSQQVQTGDACLGDDGDSLVEGLGGRCKAGDIVVTKNPAYFCNFGYSVTYNGYNSAFCVYNGEKRTTRGK